ncbi:MFS transporter [Sphingomonas oryzagri]|uniref:MFS transporter n=1 Tax=Sphingomonas oryzagri TaxID=3042314 RepID=A0ABT6N278_9SPHN|nr:MFS transporter [Sphingomonas oryzagri]MDH7639282.1 MFS transporter [Sphingomonas oryzagri]
MADRIASWRDIVLIFLIGVFGMMVVSAAVPALGGIAAEFRPPSPATIGLVMSIPALAAALTSLPIGWLVDRIGDRPTMLAGGAVICLGDAGVVLSRTMPVLLACRFVAGLGYVCTVVAAVTMIARLTEGRRRTAALALWSTVIPSSFILSSLYGILAGSALSWRAVFIGHGCGVIILMTMARLLLPTTLPDASGASRLAGIGKVLRTPWPFILGASFAAAAFLQTGFVAVLPHLLARSIGAGEAQVQSFNMLSMACNVAGAFGFGLAFARGVPPWLLGCAAVLLGALSGLGLILAPTGLGPAMAMNCALMFALGIQVGMWALLPQVAPSPAFMGATSGLITQITLLGVLFGPPVAFATSVLGAHGSLIFLAFGIVLSLVAWPVWRRSAPSPATPIAH